MGVDNMVTSDRRTKPTVFISYAAEDRTVAFKVAEELRKNGFEPWIDVEYLLPGDDWEIEINKAIRGSVAFIALLSSRSVSKRGYVQKELRAAYRIVELLPPGEVFVLPVRLDQCSLPHDWLKNIQWVDLFPTMELGLKKLICSIERIRLGIEQEKDIPGNTSLHIEPQNDFPISQLTCLESITSKIMSLIEGDEGRNNNRYTRIAKDCVTLGNVLGWNQDHLEQLRIGAVLHNIGLIFAQSVLKKPGPLTEEEFLLIRKHTIYGEQILSAAGHYFFDVACKIARSHHERWDGTGYPDALKGNAIPAEARLVAIVDVYQAMITVRSFRKALGHDVAIREMKAYTKRFFDPMMLEAFLEIKKHNISS